MIPVMDDPLGKHWEQPRDIRDAPMDDTHVLLSMHQFQQLAEYSASIPTGVYPGKCWKALTRNGAWILRWYALHPFNPRFCSIEHRRILVVDDE